MEEYFSDNENGVNRIIQDCACTPWPRYGCVSMTMYLCSTCTQTPVCTWRMAGYTRENAFTASMLLQHSRNCGSSNVRTSKTISDKIHTSIY